MGTTAGTAPPRVMRGMAMLVGSYAMYVVVFGILSGWLTLLAGTLVGTVEVAPGAHWFFALLGGAILFVGVGGVVIAYGLWQARSWAWVGGFGLAGIETVVTIFRVVGDESLQDLGYAEAAGGWVGLMIFWALAGLLWRHRRYYLSEQTLTRLPGSVPDAD
ncbi:hypothetical protein K0C01_12100 [Salinarchaeum sp. IM2453]|uniref:hypothetical protein n=1 Tax=Salinarchaeum sp. IM2453 TaxID=2862870 RepID=UPI001C83489D|nr:hypothetical protein [Salinarchaeum sp. IM2453]QZA88505.1 hypothetical protein K0C01_12100 [Salinarchaeum sp. IM2453]